MKSRPGSWNPQERCLLLGLAGIGLLVLCLIGLHPILDRSEARYALVSLRMLLSGDWITPTIDGVSPFWGKPPLAFWMSAISMQALGVNEFSVRFPVFLCTAASTLLVTSLGCNARDRSFGLLAGVVFASMAFSVLMSAYVLTDQVLAFGTMLAMGSFWAAMSGAGRTAGYIFFCALAVTVLAKGLVGLALIGPSLLLWLILEQRVAAAMRLLPVLSGGLMMLALVLPWYVLAEIRTPGFADYFFLGEHLQKYLVPGWAGDLYGVGRQRSIGWIWPYAFIGSLPWSVVVLGALLRGYRKLRFADQLADPWTKFLLVWAVVPLIFFTFARNGGLPYVLPSLPPAALLVTQVLVDLRFKSRVRLLLSLSSLSPAVLVSLTLIIHFFPELSFLPTQRTTLDLWQRTADISREKIAYIFDRPYSADFYTRGRALLASSPDDVVRMAHVDKQEYFAMSPRCLILVPDELRSRFERVGEQNATALYRIRS